jgi:hypothetical protein
VSRLRYSVPAVWRPSELRPPTIHSPRLSLLLLAVPLGLCALRSAGWPTFPAPQGMGLQKTLKLLWSRRLLTRAHDVPPVSKVPDWNTNLLMEYTAKVSINHVRRAPAEAHRSGLSYGPSHHRAQAMTGALAPLGTRSKDRHEATSEPTQEAAAELRSQGSSDIIVFTRLMPRVICDRSPPSHDISDSRGP